MLIFFADFAQIAFHNRNFFAALLCVSLPIIAAIGNDINQRIDDRPLLLIMFGAIYVGICLVGISLSGSRMGLILSMVAFAWAYIVHPGTDLSINKIK